MYLLLYSIFICAFAAVQMYLHLTEETIHLCIGTILDFTTQNKKIQLFLFSSTNLKSTQGNIR